MDWDEKPDHVCDTLVMGNLIIIAEEFMRYIEEVARRYESLHYSYLRVFYRWMVHQIASGWLENFPSSNLLPTLLPDFFDVLFENWQNEQEDTWKDEKDDNFHGLGWMIDYEWLTKCGEHGLDPYSMKPLREPAAPRLKAHLEHLWGSNMQRKQEATGTRQEVNVEGDIHPWEVSTGDDDDEEEDDDDFPLW